MTESVTESPGVENPIFPVGEQRSSAENTRIIELENEKEMGKHVSSLSCCYSPVTCCPLTSRLQR